MLRLVRVGTTMARFSVWTLGVQKSTRVPKFLGRCLAKGFCGRGLFGNLAPEGCSTVVVSVVAVVALVGAVLQSLQ